MAQARTSEHAFSVPFDKDNRPELEFESDNAQEAIEENREQILKSASPGFTFGRPNVIFNNTFLFNEGVSSNMSGRTMGFLDAELIKITYNTRDEASYDIQIYQHDGNFQNATLITTQTVNNNNKGSFDLTNVSLTIDRQFAIRINNITSGRVRDIMIDLNVKGRVP